MTLTTVAVLACDWRACTDALYGPTTRQARDAGATAGWTSFTDGSGRHIDRCPQHPAVARDQAKARYRPTTPERTRP